MIKLKKWFNNRAVEHYSSTMHQQDNVGEGQDVADPIPHVSCPVDDEKKKRGGEKGRLIDWKTEPASIIKVQPPASPPSPIN